MGSSRLGMRESRLGALIFRAYRVRLLHRLSLSLARRLEGDEFYSVTLRRILKHYHGVDVGAYSYGECMVPSSWSAGVKVGNYVSVARGVRALTRDHPVDRLSTHPFFFNRNLGWVNADTVPFGSLEVGHDAWLGANAIITSRCSRIGIGAIVGAGAVVTKDVPDFAIVAGVPARVLRYRFPEEIRRKIVASRWWERPPHDCIDALADMTRPLEQGRRHPLLDDSAQGFVAGSL